MTQEPTMATSEESAQNECIQAKVAELVKCYVSGSRSERLQVWTLALALIQKKKKTKKGKNYKKLKRKYIYIYLYISSFPQK